MSDGDGPNDGEGAKRDYAALGGWQAFKSGEWLHSLVQRSFKNYWERADAEYFRRKYPNYDDAAIAKKLIAVAAKNASLLGGAVGAAVSTDEIAGFLTAGGAGIGLPANVAIAVASVSTECIGLMRIELKLIAELGRLYRVPLDPDDPEDILTILAFALGGSAAEVAGNVGMNLGRAGARVGVKRIIAKDVLAAVKKVAAKIGVKVLQRSIVKFTVPVASIGIGAGWNYVAIKTVGKIATKHFKGRMGGSEP